MPEDSQETELTKKTNLYKVVISGLEGEYKESLDAFRNFQSRAHNLSVLIGGALAAITLFMKGDFDPSGFWQICIAALMIAFAFCSIGLSIWAQKKQQIPRRYMELFKPEETIPAILNSGTSEEIQTRISEETIIKMNDSMICLKILTKRIAFSLFWAQASVAAMFACYFILVLMKVRI